MDGIVVGDAYVFIVRLFGLCVLLNHAVGLALPLVLRAPMRLRWNMIVEAYAASTLMLLAFLTWVGLREKESLLVSPVWADLLILPAVIALEVLVVYRILLVFKNRNPLKHSDEL